MMCAWKEFLAILPHWMRQEVDSESDKMLRELRMRTNSPPELVLEGGSLWLERSVTREDIAFTINAATKYSPWNAGSSSHGYITAPGGHRIGICGEAVIKEGQIAGLREPRSICIRIARDISGIGKSWAGCRQNLLILGAPGWGKTTLLRDIARQISRKRTVSVVDERMELFPEGYSPGKRMDILSGVPKAEGIEMVLKTMGPECIAVDEITSESDCAALVKAWGCGVQLIATSHASSVSEFVKRPANKNLTEYRVFDRAIVLRSNRMFAEEGLGQWG